MIYHFQTYLNWLGGRSDSNQDFSGFWIFGLASYDSFGYFRYSDWILFGSFRIGIYPKSKISIIIQNNYLI